MGFRGEDLVLNGKVVFIVKAPILLISLHYTDEQLVVIVDDG